MTETHAANDVPQPKPPRGLGPSSLAPLPSQRGPFTGQIDHPTTEGGRFCWGGGFLSPGGRAAGHVTPLPSQRRPFTGRFDHPTTEGGRFRWGGGFYGPNRTPQSSSRRYTDRHRFATAAHVKRSITRACPARPILRAKSSSSRIRSTASPTASVSPGGTPMPVSPSTTSSIKIGRAHV